MAQSDFSCGSCGPSCDDEHAWWNEALQANCLTLTRADDEVFPQLGRLGHLERLEVSRCPKLTEAGWRGVRLPQLRQLSLEGCPELGSLDWVTQLPNLELLVLRGRPLTAEHTKSLQGTSLKRLVISACSLDAGALLPLAKIVTLRELTVHGSELPAQDIPELPRLTSLRLLGCAGVDARILRRLPAGLEQLALRLASDQPGTLREADLRPLLRLTRLRALELDPTEDLRREAFDLLGELPLTELGLLGATDDAFSALCASPLAPRLDALVLDDLALDEGTTVAGFGRFKQLARLSLRDTDVPDEALAALAGLPLVALDLSGADGLSPDGLSHLRELPRLRQLTLTDNDEVATDEGLAHLAGLQLTSLKLSECDAFSDDAAESLATLPLQRLDIQETSFTAVGLKRLATIETLVWLRAGFLGGWGGRVSQEDLLDVARRLPECWITED
jgi:hypothetical protein